MSIVEIHPVDLPEIGGNIALVACETTPDARCGGGSDAGDGFLARVGSGWL